MKVMINKVVVKKNTFSGFEYNGYGKTLRFCTNENIYYDFDSFEFGVNQNPFGIR